MEFHELVELIQDAGYNTRPYSGRGLSIMYGASCVGFSFEDLSVFQVIADLYDAIIGDDSGIIEGVEHLSKVIRGAKTDSMGMGEIMYFPRVKWIDEE